MASLDLLYPPYILELRPQLAQQRPLHRLPTIQDPDQTACRGLPRACPNKEEEEEEECLPCSAMPLS